MKILFYAAKTYDIKSFDSILPKFPEIEAEYIEEELGPRTAVMAEGFDAVCAFVSADVGTDTLKVLKFTYFFAEKCNLAIYGRNNEVNYSPWSLSPDSTIFSSG